MACARKSEHSSNDASVGLDTTRDRSAAGVRPSWALPKFARARGSRSLDRLVVLLFLAVLLIANVCDGGDQFDPLLPLEESAGYSTLDLPMAAPSEVDADLEGFDPPLCDPAAKLPLPAAGDDPNDGIKIGGAVRFQYSFEDYVPGNRRRGGDIDFDIFRIDFDGEIGDVLLSAQYRWFQYMHVIHHGWVGYRLSEEWQVQAGITRVPFGNLDFNSHNYFFSTNYYVGLEDDYDAGVKLMGTDDGHDLQLAFFKTDEMGGVDGYVDNRSDRYSYDVVGIREPGEGNYDPPANAVAENNTICLRYAYNFPLTELGASCLFGDLGNGTSSAGHRWAYAVHSNTTIDRWNLKLQFTDYGYETDDETGLMVVGAYSFFDTIPAHARVYTGGLAYTLPVDIGPISSSTFYNDFNVMNDKSGGLVEPSVMNVAGFSVAAGGLFTYFDLVSAKNHPFIGGSLGQDAGNWNTRFNINVGYYF